VPVPLCPQMRMPVPATKPTYTPLQSSGSTSPGMEWFLANVKAMAIRNLNPAEGMIDSLPSSHIEILDEKETVLYRSPVVHNTCNPMWSVAGDVPPSATDKLLVRVVNVLEKDDWTNVFEVNLSNLIVLCATTVDMLDWLPLNTFFLMTERDIVVTEELYGVMMESGDKFKKIMGIKVDLEDRPSSDKEQLETVLAHAVSRDASHAKFDELRVKLAEVLSELTPVDEAPPVVLAQLAASEQEARLALMRAQVAETEAVLARELVMDTQATADVADLVQSKLRTGLKQCEELKRDAAVTKKARTRVVNDTLKYEFLLEARRLRLLWDLEAIYPIDEYKKGQYSIQGTPLPRDLSQALQMLGDDKIASALGATAHVVLLTAKYFELPLRYPINVQGSRSYLRDPAASSSASATLPLFKTLNTNSRVAVEKLERAVLWLQRDAEQILKSVGCPYDTGTCLLGNLFFFFKRQLQPTDMSDLAL